MVSNYIKIILYERNRYVYIETTKKHQKYYELLGKIILWFIWEGIAFQTKNLIFFLFMV